MKVVVELVYEGGRKPREVEVTVKDGLKGGRLLNAVDKAVEEGCAADKEWARWNIVTVKEDAAAAEAKKE